MITYLPNHCTIVNLYGPAECTIAALFYRIKHFQEGISDVVPIGKCLPGRKVQVLDTYGQPIIPDQRQIGEIFLGGVGIFNGYFNQPQDTARVLVELPPYHNGTFYRTGDLAKINCQGELFFVGRTDFQVKLRGQRIELGEIESAIMKISPLITNVVVVKLLHQTDEHLVAYIQTSVQFNQNSLHDQCNKYLPLYMVPSLFVQIDRFPLNPNGKIDRKALPSPDFSQLLSIDIVADEDQPRTENEKRISAIWCEILHLIISPGLSASFFKLGGNSLLLMKLHHAYQKQCQWYVSISDLFRHATMKEHVQLLESQPHPSLSTWNSVGITKGNYAIRNNAAFEP